MKDKVTKIKLNNVILLYVFRDDIVSFGIIPSSKEEDLKDSILLRKLPKIHYIEPMIQVASKQDTTLRAFCYGTTMFNSSSSLSLKFVDQKINKSEDFTEVITTFKSEKYIVEHIVKQLNGYDALIMHNEITSLKDDNVLQRADAFNIQLISPFEENFDSKNLISHYFENYWSTEARKISQPLSSHFMEDSWEKYGYKTSNIHSLGLMPARNYSPFMAIEDTKNKVTWAVQYNAKDSWMIELIQHFSTLNICGGHADYLIGHWEKELKKNEKFITNEAIVSVVNGDLLNATNSIVKYQNSLLNVPSSEDEMPIIYNEYLYSWGKPNIKDIKTQMELATKLNAKYFVIDAGWQSVEGLGNDAILGDWNLNETLFPNGFKEFTSLANYFNFPVRGIWYEFEAVTIASKLYKEHPDYLARNDGKIIQLDNRCLIDFNNEDARNYLKKKVTKFLKENHLNYIKNDYNENLGFEIDGPNKNKAENVRLYAENLQNFIKDMKNQIPDLVYETCACGGMRHDISYISLGSMMSFSDAHEIIGGVSIAMNLHYLFLPRFIQIWASLLPKHSIDEIYFTIAKGMLGRLCFSGKLNELDKKSFDLAVNGSKFYKNISHIIKDGITTLIDTDELSSTSNPDGYGQLIRESKDHKELILYVFNIKKRDATIDTNIAGYKLIEKFTNVDSSNDIISFAKKDLTSFVGHYKKI